MPSITVATANTHFGEALSMSPELFSISTDIILLQELFNMSPTYLKSKLQNAHFRLLHFDPRSGLAIAKHTNSPFRLYEDSLKKHILGNLDRIEQRVISQSTRKVSIPNYRGFISCTLKHPDGNHLTIATSHPTTPISIQPRARQKQILKLRNYLLKKHASDSLILGGDMNHFPTPRKIDRDLHTATNLQPVELGSEPTWRVRGSKQEKVLSALAHIRQKPLDDFNGQHDIILFRPQHLTSTSVKVLDIKSDHRAIVATFDFL